MNIKAGSRVKIVSVIEPTNKTTASKNYVETKKKYIGKEGIVYGIPIIYHNSSNPNSYQFKKEERIYSIRDDEGKGISPYGWFKSEIKIVQI